RDRVVYPPSNIKYKMYNIDENHKLSKGAFNDILKTLEEPTQHLIYILATTETERLPQTILSRCQRFDFKRINIQNLIYNMKNILEELNIDMEDKALSLIARNSDGSMRDALSLLDQCVSFNDIKITYEDAIDILGVANKDLLFNIVDNIKNKEIEKTLMTIEDIIQDGKDIHQFIKDLIEHYRNLMVIKSSNNLEDFLEIDDIERYKEQINGMDLDHILRALEILTEAETQGRWSTQIRIILEMAAIKMVKMEETISLEERIKKLEEGHTIVKTEGQPQPAKKEKIEYISAEKQRSVKRKVNSQKD